MATRKRQKRMRRRLQRRLGMRKMMTSDNWTFKTESLDYDPMYN